MGNILQRVSLQHTDDDDSGDVVGCRVIVFASAAELIGFIFEYKTERAWQT